MKTSIATVSLSGDLREKLSAIAEAGFDGVEIFETDFLSFDRSPADVGHMIADAGLAVSTFQPFRDFEGMPEAQRGRELERAERKFDLMQEMGADLLLVCSNMSPASLGGIDRAAADFRELGERAEARGLRIGYEALAWGRHVDDYRDAWEIVRRADHPAVGLILDSFHTLARGTELAPIRAIPKDKIFLVQVADAPRLEMDLRSWSRHYRCMPGQGELDLTAFMEALDATGYDGFLSLEIFNDLFRAGSASAVAVDGRRSLIYMLDELERRKPAPERRRAVLPDKARCRGVAFIEFAVDEGGAGELGGLFGTLGFRRAGTHKSKDVTLWRQGAINLVINCEKEGFAQASYLAHGPSVCALGIEVEDAAATVARARALLARPFHQPAAPGELDIPAFRGVGGSLIYLIEPTGALGRVWETEFDLIEAAGENGGAGLTTVDHVSQSMGYDEMLSWLLFYTSVFDLETTEELDIADPAGMVRSRAVQTKDGALRITLNATQSHRTQAALFLRQVFGAGVQHVAFATDDILATMKRLKAAGLKPLAIPDNYYDDLEARLGLAPALVAELHQNGILYDRSEAGEYFQVYTRSFDERFFFEIVERRGYADFGAANAPIRLAAQARAARPAGPG